MQAIRSHSRHSLWTAILASGIYATTLAPVLAQSSSSSAVGQTNLSVDPYCGLNCLYAAAKSYGLEPDMEDLIKPEYLGSIEGSSMRELAEAARDVGLHAKILRNLTVRDLRSARHPVILHVKTEASTTFKHFVLFFGTVDGKAEIFNPPNPPELTSYADLRRVWDGLGLVVSDREIDVGPMLAASRGLFALSAISILSLVGFLHWARRRWFSHLDNPAPLDFVRVSFVQGGGLLAMGLLAGFMYHFIAPAGLLAGSNDISSLVNSGQGEFPEIGWREVSRLQGEATIIDARYERDYRLGHIDGAINIPINSTDEERLKLATGIPRNSRVILYCQSSSCQYAEKVGLTLLENGFQDLVIYRGGWVDWSARRGSRGQ